MFVFIKSSIYLPTLHINNILIQAEAQFNRPIIDEKATKGMELLQQLQGQDNIWYVGSYALYGMPLLENGVRSGIYLIYPPLIYPSIYLIYLSTRDMRESCCIANLIYLFMNWL